MIHARHPGPHKLRLCLSPEGAYRAGRRDAKGFLDPVSGVVSTAITDDLAAVTCPRCIALLADAVEKTLASREPEEEACENCNGEGYVPLPGNQTEDCEWCGGAGVFYR